MNAPIFVITGPTASGKTGRSLTLAKELGAAIISADSRMVYQGLDIGTGKPTWEYRQLDHSPWIKPRFVSTSEVTPPFFGISSDGGSPMAKLLRGGGENKKTLREWRVSPVAKPLPKWGKNPTPIYQIQGIDHYLLDVVQPETPFTLTDWLDSARRVLGELKRQGQPIVVVGGTGLYLKALLQGYEPPPTDPFVRAAFEKLETAEILEKLQKVDPLTAQREKNNRRRLVRALEIYELTGHSASTFRHNIPLLAKIINITLPRAELFTRIDQRIRQRLDSGMIEEVKDLLVAGVSADWLRRIGLEYRIITNWLLTQQNFQPIHSNLPSWKGQVDVDMDKKKGELIARLRKEIHAYARRQETYLRTQLQ